MLSGGEIHKHYEIKLELFTSNILIVIVTVQNDKLKMSVNYFFKM